MTQHTPDRLALTSQDDQVTGCANFESRYGVDAVVLYHDNAKADARRIVQCWNAHDALVEAVTRLLACNIEENRNIPGSAGAIRFARQSLQQLTAQGADTLPATEVLLVKDQRPNEQKPSGGAPRTEGSCRKCGGEMRPGQAMGQTYYHADEGTCSPSGPGYLTDCMKCSACGWSVTKKGE